MQQHSHPPHHPSTYTTSPQHQLPQHHPQRLRTLRPILTEPLLNPLDQILRLPPQLINNPSRILKAALTLHIPQRIALDLFIRSFLLEDVDEDLVAGVGADGVDYREGEFSFGQVFAQAFEGSVARGGGEVEVVVEDLEEEPDCGD